MKKPVIFFGLILFSIVCSAQSENPVISHHSNNEEISIEHICFISTRYITKEKKILLEKRLKETFPELHSISINIETQNIDITFSACISQENLDIILGYFKSDTYEIK